MRPIRIRMHPGRKPNVSAELGDWSAFLGVPSERFWGFVGWSVGWFWQAELRVTIFLGRGQLRGPGTGSRGREIGAGGGPSGRLCRGPAASWTEGPGGGSLPLYVGPCSPTIVRNNANSGNLCGRGCVLTCDMNYAFLTKRSIDVCVEGVDVESAPIVNSPTVCTLVKQSKRSEKAIQSRRLK